MQTLQKDDHAYFLYYGTRDDRSIELIGPYVWGTEQPPPPKTEYTTEIPPGETRKVGEAVPGLSAVWYRIIATGTGEVVEPYYSYYEARPLFHQIGIEPGSLPPDASASSASSAAASAGSSVRASAKPRFPVVLPRSRRNR
jgi:hypothetical protein